MVESRSARITRRAEAKLKNGRFVWIRYWAKVDERYDKGERLVTVARELDDFDIPGSGVIRSCIS